jgi:hypothetical protein
MSIGPHPQSQSRVIVNKVTRQGNMGCCCTVLLHIKTTFSQFLLVIFMVIGFYWPTASAANDCPVWHTKKRHKMKILILNIISVAHDLIYSLDYSVHGINL